MKSFWRAVIRKYQSIPLQKRRGILIVVIGIVLAYDIASWNSSPEAPDVPETNMTRFMTDARAGKVKAVEFRGGQATVTRTDGRLEAFYGSLPDELLVELMDKHIEITVSKPGNGEAIGRILLLALLGVPGFLLCLTFLRGSRRLSLGGKPKLVDPNASGLKFDDIAGQPQAKAELAEIIDFLKNPESFTRLGAKVPTGALMIGPPGVGKTLLARAVAGETNARFITTSGSDFRESYMGVGASKVRDLFKTARKHAPAIIFIDEIEVVAKKRQTGGGATGGTRNEEEATLNALLVEMDGFSKDPAPGLLRRMLSCVGVPLPKQKPAAVIVLAATNRPDMMDDALLRPGRFDRHIHFDHLDINGRYETLKVHSRNKPLADDVDLMATARKMTGVSGADLAKLLNEAAIRAGRRGADTISQGDIDAAHIDIQLGRAREDAVLTDSDKLRVAEHEAGHAVAAVCTRLARRPTRATIMPRGRSFGAVLTEPGDDNKLVTREQLIADIIVALGGRAAELIRYGQNGVSTGAEDDFKKATMIARKMAGSWSMSSEEPILSISEESSIAARTKAEEAAQAILLEAWTAVIALLKENAQGHADLVKVLLDKETVEGDEIYAIVEGPAPKAAA